MAILPGGSWSTTGCSGATNSPFPSPVTGTRTDTLARFNASPNDGSNPNNPGGTLNHLSPASVPLNCWGTSTTQSTSQMRGNSLTIVRLDTGEVLAHFTGQNYTGAPSTTVGSTIAGGTITTSYYNVFPNQPFVSPLTGVPAAYPNGTGDVADRIYVGDADGVLWRIDVSDPIPKNWVVEASWDAYLLGQDTSALRDIVQLPPVISRDNLGNTTILYATGNQSDQNAFTAQSTSTRVWSLTETSGQTPIPFPVSQNWWLNSTSQGDPFYGQRLTGPITLFNSVAYFATFLPQSSTNPCDFGYRINLGRGLRPDRTRAKSRTRCRNYFPVAQAPRSRSPRRALPGLSSLERPSSKSRVARRRPTARAEGTRPSRAWGARLTSSFGRPEVGVVSRQHTR